MNIISIVDECLRQHKGGENFFDAIDEMMRNDILLITMLTGKVLEYGKFDNIIVSGTFGKLYKDYATKNMPKIFSEKIVVVPGGLRNGTKVTPFWEEVDVPNKKFIFLDDSFYLGRTRNVIKEAIEENKGELVKTFVFYDGSREKDKNVESFYRYFDHHPEELKNPSFSEQ